MTMRPMKPMPGQQQQVQVDLSKAESISCEKCGNYNFIQTYFLKKLSPLVSTTGDEAIVPINVFSCGNCGEVPKGFIPKDE